jgi:membrane protein
LAHFGNYNATYGSLGAAIGTMTWMWSMDPGVRC